MNWFWSSVQCECWLWRNKCCCINKWYKRIMLQWAISEHSYYSNIALLSEHSATLFCDCVVVERTAGLLLPLPLLLLLLLTPLLSLLLLIWDDRSSSAAAVCCATPTTAATAAPTATAEVALAAVLDVTVVTVVILAPGTLVLAVGAVAVVEIGVCSWLVLRWLWWWFLFVCERRNGVLPLYVVPAPVGTDCCCCSVSLSCGDNDAALSPCTVCCRGSWSATVLLHLSSVKRRFNILQ